jgi:2-iminobutanoate/2-iminopropanoate deaminase
MSHSSDVSRVRITTAAIAVLAFGLGLGAALGLGQVVAQAKGHTRVLAPDLPLRPGAPYSQGVMAGDLLYLSGNVGNDPSTGTPPAAFADATRQALDNLGRVLKAAGLGWSDVVKVNVYVKDIARYEEFNRIYASTLPAPYPARTFLAIADVPAGGQLEIEAVAVRQR